MNKARDDINNNDNNNNNNKIWESNILRTVLSNISLYLWTYYSYCCAKKREDIV